MEALSPVFSNTTPYPTINNDPHITVNSLNRSISNSHPTPSIFNSGLSKLHSVCNHVGSRGIQLVQEGTKSLVNYVVQQALTSPDFDLAVPGGKAAILSALTLYQQIDYAAGEHFVCDQSDNNTNIIDLSKRCDGQEDCTDKTDETACTGDDYKKAGMFKCEKNKKVISIDKYCNGKQNCRDNSDESSCSDSDYKEKGLHKCPDGSIVKKRQPCPEIRTTNQPLINIEKTTTALPINYSDSVTAQITPSDTTTTALTEVTNSTLAGQTLLPANETDNSTELWSVNSTTAFPIEEQSSHSDLSIPIFIGVSCVAVTLCAATFLIAESRRLSTEENRPLSCRIIGQALLNTITLRRFRTSPPPQEATHEENFVRVPLHDIEAEAEVYETSAYPSITSVDTETVEAPIKPPTKSEPAPIRLTAAIRAQDKRRTKTEPTPTFLTAGMRAEYERHLKNEPTPAFRAKGMRAEHRQPSKAGPIENGAGVRLPRKTYVTFDETSF